MTATATFDLLDLPTQILNDLAAGSAIEDLAAILCRLTEAHVPGHIASIMQMGEDGASAALSGLARGIALAGALRLAATSAWWQRGRSNGVNGALAARRHARSPGDHDAVAAIAFGLQQSGIGRTHHVCKILVFRASLGYTC